MKRRRWFPWRPWTWWRARLDARKNVPPPDGKVLGETEQEIRNAANTAIKDAEQRFAARTDRVEARLNELRKAKEEIYEPEYMRLAEKTGRRDVLIFLSLTTHWILITLLGIGEGVFNMVAFNVMREPGLPTILMALMVVIAIPLFAYFIGLHLRQWPQPWWKNGIELVGAIAVVVGALIFINRVRFAYLEEIDPTFAKAHPEIGQAFLAINILVLGAAALVTYLSHDPEPGFAETKAKLDYCNAKISDLEGRLDQWATEFETEVAMLKEAGWSLMAYYRNVNRRRREQKAPNYFDDDTDKNYRPEFVPVREVGQYHGGAMKVAPARVPASEAPGNPTSANR